MFSVIEPEHTPGYAIVGYTDESTFGNQAIGYAVVARDGDACRITDAHTFRKENAKISETSMNTIVCGEKDAPWTVDNTFQAILSNDPALASIRVEVDGQELRTCQVDAVPFLEVIPLSETLGEFHVWFLDKDGGILNERETKWSAFAYWQAMEQLYGRTLPDYTDPVTEFDLDRLLSDTLQADVSCFGWYGMGGLLVGFLADETDMGYALLRWDGTAFSVETVKRYPGTGDGALLFCDPVTIDVGWGGDDVEIVMDILLSSHPELYQAVCAYDGTDSSTQTADGAPCMMVWYRWDWLGDVSHTVTCTDKRGHQLPLTFAQAE